MPQGWADGSSLGRARVVALIAAGGERAPPPVGVEPVATHCPRHPSWSMAARAETCRVPGV